MTTILHWICYKEAILGTFKSSIFTKFAHLKELYGKIRV